MSKNLVAAALEAGDESDSQGDQSAEEDAECRSDATAAAEHQATSTDNRAKPIPMQAMSQSPIARDEDTAISQHGEGREANTGASARQNEKGPGKRTAAEVTPTKKKQKVSSDQDEGIKLGNRWRRRRQM